MRALITGASARIGAAIATELASSGFDLALHTNRSPLDETLTACRGVETMPITADLGTVAGCQSVVDAVADRWDSLDLLINNASRYEPVPFEQIDAASWDQMQAVNTRAPFLLSRGLLPLLRPAKGLVVHICDIGADRPAVGFAHYSVSKAGLVMLVKAMAVELAPLVRTIGISPGHVAWPPDWEQARRNRIQARIPMRRVGTPEDVARLVRFVALEGGYLNGAIIPVDGGLSCRY